MCRFIGLGIKGIYLNMASSKVKTALVVGVCRCFEIAVGCLLGMSAVIHYSNPYFFAESIAAYGLLSGQQILIAATLIMSLCFVLAGSLIAGVWVDCSILMTVGLFVLFVVAQSFVLALGKNIECGCFGGASSSVGVKTIAIPLLCACACCAVFWVRYKQSKEGKCQEKSEFGEGV